MFGLVVDAIEPPCRWSGESSLLPAKQLNLDKTRQKFILVLALKGACSRSLFGKGDLLPLASMWLAK
jgi:hypothetical protein